MNEEQKYQQYLANGGEASFEEYQSVAAMFSPAEMDELAGLKKKDGTQPTEKNSLTAGSATTTSESTPGEPLIPNPIPQSEFTVPMGSEQDLMSASSDTTAQTPSTDLPLTNVVSFGTESLPTNQNISGISNPTLDNAGNIPMPTNPIMNPATRNMGAQLDVNNRNLANTDAFYEANKTKFAQNGKRTTLTFEGTNENPLDILGGRNNDIQGEITMTPSSPEALAADAEKREKEAQAELANQDKESSDFINKYVNKDYVNSNPIINKQPFNSWGVAPNDQSDDDLLTLESKGLIQIERDADGTPVYEDNKYRYKITDKEYYDKTYTPYIENLQREAEKQAKEQNIDSARFNQGNIGNNPEQDSFGEFMSQASKFGVIPTSEEYESLTTESARNEYLASLEATQNAQKNKTTFQAEYDKVIGKYNLTEETKFANGFDALNLLNQGIENGDDKDKAEIDFFTGFFSDRNNVMDFGEYWEREGKAKHKSSLVRENQANYQSTRADIWNDYLSYKDDKLNISRRFIEEALNQTLIKEDKYAKDGNTEALLAENAKLESLYNQLDTNRQQLIDVSSLYSESKANFTKVAKTKREQDEFEIKVQNGEVGASVKNILGQIPLALSTSINSTLAGIGRIASSVIPSENLKDALDIISDTELKVGNIKVASLTDKIKTFKGSDGFDYKEINGKTYGVNADGKIFKTNYQQDGSETNIKEEIDYNGSGMVFLTSKMISDIYLTTGVGKGLNNVIGSSANRIANSNKVAQVFGEGSHLAKTTASFAKLAKNADNVSVTGWYVQMYNDSYKMAEQGGIADPVNKHLYAVAMSFTQSIIQRINPDTNFLKPLNTNVRQIARALINENSANAKQAVVKFLKETAVASVQYAKKAGNNVPKEVLEEIIQQGTQDVSNLALNGLTNTNLQTSSVQDYEELVVGTIVPSAVASLLGGKGSRIATINNKEIDLTTYSRNDLITELARDAKGSEIIKDFKDGAFFQSQKDSAQKIEAEISTRKKYIDKIPDAEKYPTSALSEVTPILQELDRKREQLKNDDGTFAKILNTEIETLTTQVNSILSGETVSENQQQNNTTENAETPQPTPQSETVQEQTDTTGNEPEQTAVQQTPPITPVEPNGNAGAESGVTLNTEPNGQTTTEIQSPTSQTEENGQASQEERRDASNQLPEMGEGNPEPEQVTQEVAPEEEISGEEQKRLNIEALQRILQQQNSAEKVSATPDVISADANKETIQTSNPNLSVRKTTDAATGNAVYEFIDRKTGKVKKVDEKTERKHLTDLVKNTAYPETTVPEGVDNENDYNKVVLSESKNPKEIAGVLMTMPKYQDVQGTKEWHIANNISRVSRQSFINFSDENNISIGLAKAYFAEKGKETNDMKIDVIARNASDSYKGGKDGNDAITTEDVVRFMLDHRAGKEAFYRQKNPDYTSAVNRFVELTGMNPSPKVLKDVLGLNTASEDIEQRAKAYAEKQYDLLSEEAQNNLANEYDQWFNSLTLQEQTAELQNTYPYENISANEESEVQNQPEPSNAKGQSNKNAPDESPAKVSDEKVKSPASSAVDFNIIGTKGADQLGKAMNSAVMIQSLRAAKEMDKAGDTSRQIHQQTGWHKGSDGKWKFELDYDIQVKNPTFDFIKGIQQTTLAELIDYPALFAAYPQLKNTKVISIDFGHTLSDMSESDGNIYLNSQIYKLGNNGKLTSKLPLGTILHEQQHIIQGIEGFSRGGDPTRIANTIADELYRSGREYGTPNERRGIISEVEKQYGKQWRDTVGKWSKKQLKNYADALYIRLGGEVEARNVAYRLSMKPDFRQYLEPGFSEDVSPESQVLIEAGLGNNNSASTDKTFTPIPQKTYDKLVKRLLGVFKKFGGKVTTDWNDFKKQAGLSDIELQLTDYRMSHSAPIGSDESGMPLHNLVDIYGDDIYDSKAWYYFGDGGDRNMDKQSASIIQNLRGNPDAEVTVYRAVPSNVSEINTGDWVSINRQYAVSHGKRHIGKGYKIIETTVKAGQVFTNGDSLHEQGVEFMYTKDGEIYGAKSPNGTIYLNPEKVNANTPIHEFSHLWQQLMPARFKKGVELLKNTPIGKRTFADLKANAGYANKSDAELWNEAMVTVMGNEGERIFNSPRASKFKEWLVDLFKKLGNAFGIRNLSPTDKLSTFVKGALGEVMGNSKLVPETNMQTNNNIDYSFLSASDFDADGNVKPEVLAQIETERNKIKEDAVANGTWMKAPNGENTNLNEQQWVDVRTKRFQDFFGDWQNDAENASKVVDENGEPMVVYHGTGQKFSTFEMNNGAMGNGAYFSSVFEESADYAAEKLGQQLNEANDYGGDWVGKYIQEVFLNIRNSDMISKSGYGTGEKIYLATSPNEIKSATTNAGTYSNKTGRIDFQIPNKTLTEIVKAIDSNGNDSGFEKLQNSDWYQNLSDTEQAEFNSGNYVQKLLSVSTDQGKSAEKENTSLKDKIEKIKEKYSQKIAEVKANSAKTSRERIAKIRNIQKQAYEDVVDLVTKDKIRRKMTPGETSRLIKAAAAILNTNQTEKALERFVDLYNKTNSYEYEKQAANDKKRLDKISDAVNNAFSNGETLQDVYDSNPNLFKFDGPKEIARRVFERLESEKNPDLKVLEKSLERSRQVNDAINRRPSFMEAQKAVRRRIIKEATDRQFLPKHILKNIGAKQTYNRMVAVGGASASAKNMYQKTHDKIFAKLTNEDKAHLNEMIKLKRVIAIDENREQRGMEPIDHEGGTNKFSAKKALDQMKEKIGAEKFNQLDKNSTVYFDAFKDILKQMKEAGMINDAQYESMADVDYQPRQVLSHLFDMEFDKAGKLIKMTPITGEDISDSFPGLSKDQIRSFQEGSLGLIMNDAESLLSNAILGRTKAIFMNRVNKTFINRDFPAAKLEYETLKSKAEKDLTSENKRFIKYFEELGTMVKENPMVDISPSGKPVFMFKDLPSANWKRAYYFENGIRKEFFMRKDLYEDWHDTMTKLDGVAKDIISTVSGSGITKIMATGRNPGFALVNTPRDFGSLILFSEEYSNNSLLATVQVAKDAFKGIREIYRYNNTEKDNILEKYLQYGGGMDFLNTEGETPTALKLYEKIFGKNTVNNKTKTTVGNLFDYATLKPISNYSEMMFRVGVFNRAVNNRLQKLGTKNISDLDARTQEDIYIEAVERSRKILDFNQGGRTAKSLEAVIPYLNAATQGGRVLADSMTNRPYATTARLLQGAGLLASAGIGMTMLALSAFDDDDEDKRTAIEKYLDIKEGLSRFQKRGYVHFFTGKKNENGEYTSHKMAIPQALTPLYTFVDNILDDVLRNIAGRKTNGLGLATDEAQEAFSANVDPIGITDFTKLGTKNPIIKSMVTYASGYDFFRDQNLDGSINKVPRRVEGFENKKVEDFYKKFGLETGFSPVRTKAAVESILTSPDTNPFLSMIYGGVDAAVGYDSGFTEKKGFAKTFIGSFEKRISAETSDYSRFNNSLSEDARKRVEDKAVDDYLIDTIVTSAVKSNKDNNGDWLNGEVQKVMNNKSITKQKQAYLIEKLATKYTDLKTKGGGDPAIGYIKYETFGKSQAKAQAIIEIYGKDFPRNKEVMQKLMLNQLLTDDVIINLDAYGIKFNNLREQIQDLQEELR